MYKRQALYTAEDNVTFSTTRISDFPASAASDGASSPFCDSCCAAVDGDGSARLPANVTLSLSGGNALAEIACGGSAGKLLSSTTAPLEFEFALAVLGILLLFLRLAIKLS